MVHNLLFINQSGPQTRLYCSCRMTFTSKNPVHAIEDFVDHQRQWLVGLVTS